jgi:hypothetical protein
MTGRSSRTMNTHNSELICIDARATNDSLYDVLTAGDMYEIKDGYKIVRIMIGRRKFGLKEDA